MLKHRLKSFRPQAVPCACLFIKSKFYDLTAFGRKSFQGSPIFTVRCIVDSMALHLPSISCKAQLRIKAHRKTQLSALLGALKYTSQILKQCTQQAVTSVTQSLARTKAGQYRTDSFNHNQNIQPQGKVLNVVKVILEFKSHSFNLSRIALINLRPAR